MYAQEISRYVIVYGYRDILGRARTNTTSLLGANMIGSDISRYIGCRLMVLKIDLKTPALFGAVLKGMVKLHREIV